MLAARLARFSICMEFTLRECWIAILMNEEKGSKVLLVRQFHFLWGR